MPKPLLTKKKKQHVIRRKPQAVKGKVLNYNAAVEIRYAKAIMSLVNQMTQQCRREAVRLFKSESSKKFFAQDANVGSEARKLTNQLTGKFNQLFAKKAQGLAEKMVNDADMASTSNLHQSLKEMSGGLSLKTSVYTGEMNQIMTAAVAENVGLIKSIAAEHLQKVQGAVMRSITTGNGLKDLLPALEKYDGMTKRRAKNIALDQTKKAYNSLNQGKMQKLGVQKYEWVHSGGSQKPRPEHIALSGKIFSFDDPPIIDPDTGQRGKPGDLPNCGCRMRPVITFDEGNQGDGSTD